MFVSGLYYGITIALVSFATAMTSFTLNIHHKGSGGRPVPHLVKFICFKLLARLLCLKIHSPHEPLVSLVSTVTDSLKCVSIFFSELVSLKKLLFFQKQADRWGCAPYGSLSHSVIWSIAQNCNSFVHSDSQTDGHSFIHWRGLF